ncbi:MAG: metallophosphoesterase [Ornithinimicrobium sp.]|uniref:metallophosphoesterase family protein n=1 Tax=Ornithinimicrobium sp. TaxID=1977084 RepID=UPI0026E0FF89|nr:metallophosphoesterase [Ornithinimicrobium sp.]MDO5738974.1 metallophosphoesterase [Ornithinimicrobium sp.]
MRIREHIPRGVRTGLRRTVVVALLALVAFMGGVATTALWPVQTQTRYFTADVSVEPRLDSTVQLPTVVGDVILTFDGLLPAPGLTAQVQVRDEVTDLLRTGRLNSADLQPHPDELRAAIDSGVAEVAWKFAAGAMGTTLLALLAYAVARPRHAGHVVLISGLATALALAGPGAAAYLTYRTANVTEFRATSLLSLVQTNRGILDDLSRKADQGAIYVTNLLALSDAVRQEFNPDAETAPAAARFLLVSDIHGLNQYPLMRAIIATEGIDAVIDTGDLINFGEPAEGDLTDIYSGIESLGVPYIFVSGNHDALSLTDDAMLRRMARVPGVLLVEPTAGTFQRIDVNGVSISGFNDHRYFNQRDEDFADQQVKAARAFTEATAGSPPTDLVLTHEPYAANRVRATLVTINGHMHVQALNNEHIQLGSFTGGGLVNQFRIPPLTDEAREAAKEDPATAGELVGHPYSFDILTVGQDCSVTSLTRYNYRNLVSGRPQFDDISIINGRTLQASTPLDRTCGRDLGVQVSDLAQAQPVTP